VTAYVTVYTCKECNRLECCCEKATLANDGRDIMKRNPMPPGRQIERVLDTLAMVLGVFGQKGWAEVEVTNQLGASEIMPTSKPVDEKVRTARRLLAEFGLRPTT